MADYVVEFGKDGRPAQPDGRLDSEAFHRNAAPIRAVLARLVRDVPGTVTPDVADSPPDAPREAVKLLIHRTTERGGHDDRVSEIDPASGAKLSWRKPRERHLDISRLEVEPVLRLAQSGSGRLHATRQFIRPHRRMSRHEPQTPPRDPGLLRCLPPRRGKRRLTQLEAALGKLPRARHVGAFEHQYPAAVVEDHRAHACAEVADRSVHRAIVVCASICQTRSRFPARTPCRAEVLTRMDGARLSAPAS